MKKLEEYQAEMHKVGVELQKIEQMKATKTTRAVELQGIIRELSEDEVKKDKK